MFSPRRFLCGGGACANTSVQKKKIAKSAKISNFHIIDGLQDNVCLRSPADEDDIRNTVKAKKIIDERYQDSVKTEAINRTLLFILAVL